MKRILIYLCVLAVCFTSCGKEESNTENVEKILFSFSETSHVINENVETYSIPVRFKEKFDKLDEIEFQFISDEFETHAVESEHFEVVGVERVNDTLANIVINVIQDEIVNEPRLVYMELLENDYLQFSTSGNAIGRTEITILDDDFVGVSSDHPLYKYQGNYIGNVTYYYEEDQKVAGDDNGDMWNMKVRLEETQYDIMYISGFRNTTDELMALVSHDGKRARIAFETTITNAYPNFDFDGVNITGLESPLAGYDPETDTYGDVIIMLETQEVTPLGGQPTTIEVQEGELYIGSLDIGVILPDNNNPSLLQNLGLSMMKQ